MTSSNSSMPLPTGITNPLTPLAYLEPALASQFEASRYIYVATLGAYVWDLLKSSPQEYKMLFKQRLSPPLAVYFFSRVIALAYIITSTIFQVAPVSHCQALQVALGCCFALAVPSTALLFLLRIRAVFSSQKWIVFLFCFLWLATLGTAWIIPFSIDGAHIGPTSQCINTKVQSYTSAAVIMNTVNDTMVFIAISVYLFQTAHVDGPLSLQVLTFIRGSNKSGIAKIVLQGGQLYYLATVGLNIVTAVLVLTPSVPPVIRAMMTIPNIALENAMACLVFRQLRLGIIKTPTTIASTSRLGSRSQGPNRVTFSPARVGSSNDTGSSTVGSYPLQTFKKREDQLPVQIHVHHDTFLDDTDTDGIESNLEEGKYNAE